MAAIQLADAMQLPTADATKSMAEWLAGRLDIAPETARRLAAASKRIADSPELANELARGEVTFDRAEATSKIPPESQDRGLKGLDIAGLRRLAAHHKRLTRADDLVNHRAQHLTMQPNLDESIWDMWGRLDGYAGPVVFKRLTEEADLLPESPDGRPMGVGYRRAVALTSLCEGAKASTPSTPLISVFVDDKGAEAAGATAVGPGILDKIACSGKLEIIKTVEGKPLSVGRASRVISNKLRRFVLHRDGGCAADGCTSRYRLQPHHIVPWSEGGPTDEDNLITLCWFHHHVIVHGWGYQIDDRLGRGRIRFVKPGHDPPGP